MTVVELIERKREGSALTTTEIDWLIRRYTAGEIPDYQMSALLMAIFFKGLNDRELAAWTSAMMYSGDVMDLSQIDRPKVDKHSTGGVGDKVSLPLAPIVAACGVAVPMISGRGLGHTGGTLDKLESIPGFRVRLPPAEFLGILEKHGMVMAGQSDSLVPADREIYGLRDVTGTVPSIPLIASSIMSKKLAEDIDALVLDVKVGTGAFMKHEAAARKLATTMVEIGRSHGTSVVALLTDMNQPLGREVGNANEVAESIAVLRGEGPDDLTSLVFRLAEEMLILGGRDALEASDAINDAVQSGHALEMFRAVVVAQGGDPSVVDDPTLLDRAKSRHEVLAPSSGYLDRCDALDIGTAAVRLGAGRAVKTDDIDHGVGITLLAKRGDRVDAGQPVALVSYRDPERLESAEPLLERAWSVSTTAPRPEPLIIGKIG